MIIFLTMINFKKVYYVHFSYYDINFMKVVDIDHCLDLKDTCFFLCDLSTMESTAYSCFYLFML